MTNTQQDFVKAKSGNSLAFKKLFTQYLPVVFKLQKQYRLKGLDDDDWQQEARIIFFKSLKTFDLQHGLTFGCFFRMNFERHVYSLLRHQGAEKRKTELISESLEARIEKVGESMAFYDSYHGASSFQYIVVRDVLHGFEKILSPFERQVFRRLLAAEDINVMVADIQCSEGQVNNAIDRIKRKFKFTIQ